MSQELIDRLKAEIARLTAERDAAVDRAAAYEGTGLEPEEITRLCDMDKRAKMADLLRLEEYQALGPIDHLRELAVAEQDGRCVVLPFVAMVEQSLQDGKMTPQRDQRFNGRYAVVYNDPQKWASPLIDVCGGPYNREQAEARMAELTRAEAEAAQGGGEK